MTEDPITPDPITPGFHPKASDLPEDGWRWPHFSAVELACKCKKHCQGEYYHDPAFLDGLERLRAAMGPLKIRSGRRCMKHNAAVGGARSSMHMRKIAVDVSLAGHDRAKFAREAVKAGFRGISFGRSFIHLDRGTKRAWTYPGAMPLWIKALGFNPVTGLDGLSPKKAIDS